MSGKISNLVSPKETTISGGVTLQAGTMVVESGTNGCVVVPTTQLASTFLSSIGGVSLKTIDYPARVGHFPDTGKCIFETLG